MKPLENENWVHAIKDPDLTVRRLNGITRDYTSAREIARHYVRLYRQDGMKCELIMVREKFIQGWMAGKK
jgi:hypothetical protein